VVFKHHLKILCAYAAEREFFKNFNKTGSVIFLHKISTACSTSCLLLPWMA